MFRYFVLPYVFLLASNFGTSLPVNPNDLVKLDISNLKTKISDLETKIQGLTNRLNSARVQCQDKTTPWNARSDAAIMNLDRHNVQCPPSYFLSRFQLVRIGDYNSANVRYNYRCCKFIL